jgi:hypothetical protein
MVKGFVGHKDDGHTQAQGRPDQDVIRCIRETVRIDIDQHVCPLSYPDRPAFRPYDFFYPADDTALQAHLYAVGMM